MHVAGIICEYDPFHNGHAHHLAEVRRRSGCDFIVCAMSGCFTQRGRPALLSKWARAEMALRCGADAVFELPTLFAVRDAQRFAIGGVSLLMRLGVVTHLGFGSEAGDLDALYQRAKVEPDLTSIREGLAQGMTLARARGEALGISSDAPNDTLGVEYLRAMKRLGSAMRPVAIPRAGMGHHDGAMGALASATAVREALRRGEEVYQAMPLPAYALLRRLQEAGAVQAYEGLDAVLLALLRAMPADVLAETSDISEGLENRLLRAAQEAVSRDALIEQVKCKRYLWARISRVCTQAMLGITKRLAAEYPVAPYARLLGFRRDAQPLMAAIQRSAAVPVITRAAKFRAEDNACFALDVRAGDLWALGQENPAHWAGHQDYTQGIVIVE